MYDSIYKFLGNNEPDEYDIMVFNEPEFIDVTEKVLRNINNWEANNKTKFQKLIEKIKNYFAKHSV